MFRLIDVIYWCNDINHSKVKAVISEKTKVISNSIINVIGPIYK
jgi:hypothetical protein